MVLLVQIDFDAESVGRGCGMNYQDMRAKHQKEFEELPIFWAFSKSQFAEGVEKLGITKDEKLTHIRGGGYIRTSDVQLIGKLIADHGSELAEAMKDDDFLYGAFEYELGNHEYGYTHEIEPTLEALGLELETVRSDERMRKLLKKAMAEVEKYGS